MNFVSRKTTPEQLSFEPIDYRLHEQARPAAELIFRDLLYSLNVGQDEDPAGAYSDVGGYLDNFVLLDQSGVSDRVCGVASLERPRGRDRGVGNIHNVVVAKVYRKQGLGRLLLKGVEAHASDIRIPELWLTSTAGSEGFYEKAGYLPVRPDTPRRLRKEL